MSIKILKLKPLETGGACVAFFDIELKNTMQVHGMQLFMKDGKSWVSPPSRPYQNPEGKQCYAFIVSFADQATTKVFCNKALEAAKAYCLEHKIILGANRATPAPVQQYAQEHTEDDLPF